jgi:hypothetical protein
VIEFAEAPARVAVDPAEYNRLLGYPPDRVPEDRAAELAQWAREWYAANGRPWVYARLTARLALADGAVAIEGVPFAGSRLRARLGDAEAESVVLVAVSAGPELEAEAGRVWREERPDEYFFLEMFGAAVVEHLLTSVGARLCDWAEAREMAVLPHDSPGYPGWDVAEQPALLALLAAHARTLPGPLDVLASGALVPKKSQLAVFGVTRHVGRLSHLATLVPCRTCGLAGCQYRRSPYRRAAPTAGSPSSGPAPRAHVALRAPGPYRVSTRALERWSRERLSLVPRADGGIDAVFRYDGTTCTNMGRELTFLYTVTLGREADGYPIRAQQCGPAPGDVGHVTMCQYLRDPGGLLAAIARERPRAGRPLDDVLSWQAAPSAAGCYCDPASRDHKWSLVLQTIHYALARRETAARPGATSR